MTVTASAESMLPAARANAPTEVAVAAIMAPSFWPLLLTCQPLSVASAAPLALYRVSVVLVRKFEMPKAARPGPMPRRRRFLPSPLTMKPTINVSLPGPDMARAEKFMMWLKPAGGAITMVTVVVLVPLEFVAEIVTT